MSVEPIRESRSERRARQIGEFCGHLIALRNVDAAAKACNVTGRTARRWLASDAFGEAYVELNRPTLEANARLARASTPTALQACTRVVSDPTAAPTAVAACARVIIDANVVLNEVPDAVARLERQIGDLRQQLQEARKR